MGMVTEQDAFLHDMVKLLQKAWELGFIITGGELWRPIEMQQIYVKRGRSKTLLSNHLNRMAIDLNFFWKGQLSYDWELIRPLGDYWESLSEKNRWGGYFKSFQDVPHFERNRDPVSR